jgi:hypothetical protein
VILTVRERVNMQKLIGTGSDNASVMVGDSGGVYGIMKGKCNLPKLILVFNI